MRILLVAVALLLGCRLGAEDIVHVEATVFDAAEDAVVNKADIDASKISEMKNIKRRSGCSIKARFGQDAELSVRGTDAAGNAATMTLKVRCDLDGDKIKFQTRSADHAENPSPATAWFEVTGACASGETALYKSKNARTGRMDYFYLTFKKEAVPEK